MDKIQLIEVKSEIGAGTRGASMGIDALKIAALDFRSKLFKNLPSTEVPDENEWLFQPFGSPYAKRLEGVVHMQEKVAQTVATVLKQGDFPIVLSGDHSNAGGTIAGIKKMYPKAKLGVIWIDAHADMHTPYTSPSGNVHGMPLAAAMGIDNIEKKANSPDEKTIKLWEQLKNVGVSSPHIQPEDLVFIALRDFEQQEDYLIKKHRIKVVPVSEIRRKGVDKICRNTLDHLKNCDYIYISFDVDSMDASISKGTGTPVLNGINEREAADIVLCLIQNEKICCFEITEINPTLDKENLMAENAFEILQKVVNQLRLG